jgi:hypothetical protein
MFALNRDPILILLAVRQVKINQKVAAVECQDRLKIVALGHLQRGGKGACIHLHILQTDPLFLRTQVLAHFLAQAIEGGAQVVARGLVSVVAP